MYFGMKSYLKTNCNHTVKHTLDVAAFQNDIQDILF
jgi:hypothetical protein